MFLFTRMYRYDLHFVKKPHVWTVLTTVALLLFRPSLCRGVRIFPCGDGGVREVLADQDTVFTCTAQGAVEWRLQFYGASSSDSLATCEDICEETDSFGNLFIASVVKARQSSSMTIKAANRSGIAKLLNGSLLCVSAVPSGTDRCGLNYVSPPEAVSCSSVNTSWSVTVFCDIVSVYSSRGLYTCQLYRQKNGSGNKTLELTDIVIPSSKEILTEGEVKVSGFCRFNTSVPLEEGQYGFFVIIAPGGQTYDAKSTAGYKWIESEDPHSPSTSCSPQPYVLENTNVTCTCRTTSLGQPEGFLRWITGNQKKEQKNVTPQELHYTSVLTLSDHGNTWFRCDIIRGEKETHGEIYTASVGYAAKPKQFLLNGFQENTSVSDGEQVKFLCECDGRPTPNVSIYNNDNTSVIVKGSSVINYTFIARCEDTATYTCLTWNEFSRHVTTSRGLDLDILCKPQSRSSNHLGEYIVSQQMEMKFGIIVNPVPHRYHVWLAWSPEILNESIDDELEVFINISCMAGKVLRYISTCTLVVSNTTSLSTGSYKVQIINEAGDENFTFILTFPVNRNSESSNLAAPVGVVCAVLFICTIAALVLIRNQKGEKGPSVRSNRIPPPLRLHVGEAEVNVDISQPERSLTPLYAVVDKTKKKVNTRPDHMDEPGKQMEKSEKRDSRLPLACEVVYAVVDKTRSRYPAKVDNPQKLAKKRHSRPEKGSRVQAQMSEESRYNYRDLVDYQNTMSALPAQDQDGGTWDVSTPPPRSQTADDGKWRNSAGLLYTLPNFHFSSDIRSCPPSTQDKTEYCTLRLIEKKFFAFDEKSND